VAAGPGDLEGRDAEAAERRLLAGDGEFRTDEHHVHRQAAATLGDEVALCRSEHLRGGLPGRVLLREEMEAFGVDAHRVAHRRELLVALHGTSQVEFDVEREDVGRVPKRQEVPDRQHIVEAVDPDTLSAQSPGKPVPGLLGEDLVIDPARPMLPDVTRFGREDDRRLSLAREQYVGVAVDDPEAGQIRDGAFEARVLGAADDQSVDAGRLHRAAHGAVAALDLLCAHHDRSNPFTSAQIARLSGVATSCCSPKRTMPPFR
jgi:hypothetical protein